MKTNPKAVAVLLLLACLIGINNASLPLPEPVLFAARLVLYVLLAAVCVGMLRDRNSGG